MNKRAQIAPFMVLVIAVIILAIAATMLIGEAVFQRIRLANIADSALITVASKFCQSLNQIKAIHTRMFLNYISLQTSLITMTGTCGRCYGIGVFCSIADGYARTLGMNLLGIQSNYSLCRQAGEIARNAGKNMRTGLYDASFGGALVDEPKPFLSSEVSPDGGLDYEAYANRDSNFTTVFRTFKKANPKTWFINNRLSYSFNKSTKAFLEKQGTLTVGAPEASYESYLSVTLEGIPTEVQVKPQRMIVVFFKVIYTPWGCIPIPIPVPHPWAWINSVYIGSSPYTLRVQKKLTFKTLPFFSRDIILTHNNAVKIRGTVWSSYDFTLTQ